MWPAREGWHSGPLAPRQAATAESMALCGQLVFAPPAGELERRAQSVSVWQDALVSSRHPAYLRERAVTAGDDSGLTLTESIRLTADIPAMRRWDKIGNIHRIRPGLDRASPNRDRLHRILSALWRR